jgi:hypothetical protein
VPDALLALAWAAVYSRDTGAELAMIAAVLQLAAWGFAAGWPTQHRLAPAIVDCAFGLAIVGLRRAAFAPRRPRRAGSPPPLPWPVRSPRPPRELSLGDARVDHQHRSN